MWDKDCFFAELFDPNLKGGGGFGENYGDFGTWRPQGAPGFAAR